MAVLPESRLEQIEFCETHWPVWEAAPPATIGLTAAQVTALKVATEQARTSFSAAQSAREAAKAATMVYYTHTATMRNLVSDDIRQIKAFAELQANPATVYAAAQIPEPAAPTPAAAPGKPTNIAINLEPSGAVTLTWEATDAAASGGAFFNIFRKLPGQTSFVPVGGAPGSTTEARRMSFTDFTVPTSAAGAGAQYIIQGRRGSLSGEPSDALIVQFGVDDGGGFSVQGGEAGLKMAA